MLGALRVTKRAHRCHARAVDGPAVAVSGTFVSSVLARRPLRRDDRTRHADDYAQIARDRPVAFEMLPTDDRIATRALEVQAALATTGQHRAVKLADLLIAATAERRRVEMLHYDHDFDRIAQVTHQPTRWVAPAGEIP